MPWGATSRWAVSIAAIIATLAAIWFVMIQFPDPVSQRNADRIQWGMTRQQVLEIMGREPDKNMETEGVLELYWSHKRRDATLMVSFYSEKVFHKELFALPEDPSLWTRLSQWIGW